LTVTYEKNIGNSKVAIFTDKDGNVIRRTTENVDKQGTVYDDKIIYYENGEPVVKKVRYLNEPQANIYVYDPSQKMFKWSKQK
jgi:hypothetical protein